MIRSSRPLVTRSARIRFAERWLELSGIFDLLDTTPPKVGGRGRPAHLPRFDARGLLIAMAEVALTRDPLTYAQILTSLYFTYTDEELEALGMPDLRTHPHFDRFAAAQSLGRLNDRSSAIGRLWVNEHSRLWKAFERIWEPANDNLLQNKTPVTNRELQAAREAAAADARANGNAEGKSEEEVTREEVFNRLIMGSLWALNSEIHPDLDPTDLHDGILTGHKNDYGIDETGHVVARSARSSARPGKRHARAEKAAATMKENSGRPWSEQVGLTLVCTVSRPGFERIPTLFVAGAIAEPRAGRTSTSMTALRFLEQIGFRKPPAGREKQWVATDMAYNLLDDYVAGIHKMGFNPIFDYKVDAVTVRVLKTAKTATELHAGTRTVRSYPVPGHLVRGVPVCPGVPRKVIDGLHLDLPQPIPSSRWGNQDAAPRYDEVEFRRHQRDSDWLASFEMTSNGRPVATTLRGPGRPGNLTTDGVEATVHKQTLMCPARGGKVRCPLFEPSMDDPSKPLVPAPPAPDRLPETCCQDRTRFVYDNLEIKFVQPLRQGTWEHSDLLRAARARNEAAHLMIKSPHAGSLLDRRIEATKNAFLTVGLALCVGAANHHTMTAWLTAVANNDGIPPMEPSGARRAARDRQHNRPSGPMAA